MPAALSIDLALTGGDLGIALGRTEATKISLLPPPTAGPLEPEPFATWLAESAEHAGATVIAIDGPCAWRDPSTGEQHARRCERLVHTPSKTGLPGHVKPGPYLRFTEFSIALFDALHARGWPRAGSLGAEPGRTAVETFPCASWRALGLAPLPSKRKSSADALSAAHGALSALTDWELPPLEQYSHDALQALVTLPAALALAAGDPVRLLGEPPRLLEGSWREGYILLPEQRPALRPLPVSSPR